MENTRILVILIVVINHGIVAISSKLSTKKSSEKSKKKGCYKTKKGMMCNYVMVRRIIISELTNGK